MTDREAAGPSRHFPRLRKRDTLTVPVQFRGQGKSLTPKPFLPSRHVCDFFFPVPSHTLVPYRSFRRLLYGRAESKPVWTDAEHIASPGPGFLRKPSQQHKIFFVRNPQNVFAVGKFRKEGDFLIAADKKIAVKPSPKARIPKIIHTSLYAPTPSSVANQVLPAA